MEAKCKVCGSKDVEHKTWYNPNTETIGEDCIFDDELDTWCEDCQDNTGIEWE